MLNPNMSLLSLSRIALVMSLLALAISCCLTEQNSAPTNRRPSSFVTSAAPFQKNYPSTLGGASFKELQSKAAQQVASAANGAQAQKQSDGAALDNKEGWFRRDKRPEIKISNLQKASSSPEDDESDILDKQEPSTPEGLVPVGTGGIYNINNRVSNIKMGNTKRQDYNVVNQVVNSAPQSFRNLRIPTNRKSPASAASNVQDIFGPTFVNQFAPKRQATDYDNYFGDNDDDYANYFGQPTNQEANIQQPTGYLDDADAYQNHRCSGTCGHRNAINGNAAAKKPVDGKKAKGAKPKTKPSAEQLELKEKLLNLASKATENVLDDGDEVPLLKFNKQTGKYEAVQLDPSANAYKEKLRAALEALSAKKLPTKKLKRVLSDLEGPAGADPSETDQTPEPVGRLSSNLQAKLNPRANNVRSSRNGFDADGADSEDVPIRTLRQQPAAQYPDQYSGARQNGLSYSSEPVDLDSDRSNLVQEVRAVLNENLQRVDDVTYFSAEFLNQLLAVDDEELTPVEAEFKKFILCREDERFCTNQPNSEQDVGSSSQPEGYEQTYEEPEEEEQQQQSEFGQYGSDEPLEYNQYSELDEPDEQVEPTASEPIDDRRYSRKSSEQNYVFKHSLGGARNGVPLSPQSAHFAHQSSFSRASRPQPATSSNPIQAVEPQSRGRSSQAPAKYQQQKVVPASGQPQQQPQVQVQAPAQAQLQTQVQAQAQADATAKQQRLSVGPSSALNVSAPKAQTFKASPPPAAPMAVAPKSQPSAAQQLSARRAPQSANLQRGAAVSQPAALANQLRGQRADLQPARRAAGGSVENKQFL